MKEKLKVLDLKLTELAQYLNISRPTLYKFLQKYNENDRKNIQDEVLHLFDFINQDSVKTKRQVLKYIINETGNNKQREGPNAIVDLDMDEMTIHIIEEIRNMSQIDKEHLLQYINLIKGRKQE